MRLPAGRIENGGCNPPLPVTPHLPRARIRLRPPHPKTPISKSRPAPNQVLTPPEKFQHDSAMTATLEELTLGVMRLPDRQRLALAGFLLEMTDATADGDTDEAWEREIQERIRAVDSGIPWEQVMQKAEQRLAA